MKKATIFVLIIVLGCSSLFAQDWQEYVLPDSIFEINYSRVWDFDIDSDENLWIATTNGFIKWKGGVLEHYDKNNTSIFDNCIGSACWSICVDKFERIWIGGEPGLNITQFTPPDNWISHSPYSEVYGIVTDSTTNDIWFWGYDKGVVKYDGVSFEMWYVSNSSMPTNEVTDVDLEIGSTIAWLSTTEGVVKIENGDISVYDTTNSILRINNIYGGVIDSENCKYFGTNEGLYSFQDGLWTRLDSLNSNVPIYSGIIPLGRDKLGGVWFQGNDSEDLLNICRYYNSEWQIWNSNNSDFGNSLTYKLTSSERFVYIISERKVYVLDISSYVDNIKINNVKMYPNPSRNNVFLKSINLISSVNIFGVGGELVETISKVNSKSIILDVSKLNFGLYSVNVILENGRVVKKKLLIN